MVSVALIMGNTDDELDKIDPIEKTWYGCKDNGYVDGDGKPLGDFAGIY